MIQLTIHDVAFGGKGVARHEGKVVFVPFVIPGEAVTAKIVRDKKKFAEAELVSVETPSPDRVDPPCPYFGRCGGCAYQHMTYERQLALKSAQVEQTLRRVGRLAEVPMRPIIPAPKPYGYRNRIRVHVADGIVGFFAWDAHALIDIEQCPIAAPVVNEALRRLRGAAVRDGDYSLRAPGGGPFFEQTNPEVTAELVAHVSATVARGRQLLIDAFCGGGLFARELAGLFEKVIGIEENAEAVSAARRHAKPHEHYIAGDVAAFLGEILATHDAARTTLLLDPPATGLSARVLDLAIAGAPAEIVYVSCNPATLARDLATLCRSYTLTAVTPVDMFPQTAEIEVVAHLARRG
ncbi:MAG TPA: class I SAM-dependent RNA methyltransferase [Chthoniobacteraceae bacterium]|nr:class I SAM-dependent RNA methyltransferase [Chthoniobacteraceae bacterium]